jgi:hypothetical protein
MEQDGTGWTAKITCSQLAQWKVGNVPMITARTSRRVVGGLLLALGLAVSIAPIAQASQKPDAAGVARLAEYARLGAATKPSYKYTLSVVAWTGSRSVIAATDSHGDLYYFWQASGTSKWHQQLVAKGGHASGYSKASIAWTGHAVVIAALDASGDLVYFAQHTGSTKWNYTRVAKASGGRYQAPSITSAPGGTVLISAGNTAGELMSFELAAGSSSWTALRVAYGKFGASSIASCSGSPSKCGDGLGLITATSGGTLYFWWEILDVPGWNQETVASPGPAGSYTGGSIAATSNDLLVTAANTAGGVDMWWQAISGSGWSEQTVAVGGSPAFSHAAIAWTGLVNTGPFSHSYDVITATSHSGKLDYWWKVDGSGSTWTAETVASAGKQAVYANPGITVTGKSVIITAINTKPGDVFFWYQPFGATVWHKQLVAKG